MNCSEKSLCRWTLTKNDGISWNVSTDTRLPHNDHLEMSGRLLSVVVRYGVDENGCLTLSQSVTWPTLRTIPNNTHASLLQEYEKELTPQIKINSISLSQEKPYLFEFDGLLTIKSTTEQQIDIIRTIFPSTDTSAVIERIELINKSSHKVFVDVCTIDSIISQRGCYGIYMLEVSQDLCGLLELEPNQSISFAVIFSGRKLMDNTVILNAIIEEQKRREFINQINNSLILHTPSDVINQAFNFAKIRSSECIFTTKSGLMHCPGGLAYYAAVWTNDEAEYAGPFFPFLGDKACIEASLNCYRMFQSFMGPDYKALPSSIIAEGLDIWEGAGDRGDAAMYAYGAARFVLSMGDRKIAQELWPAIEWCIEYCRRQMTPEGVIASDSDELEGRFSTGSANLATSSLTYGALKSAANLARELGKTDIANDYDTRSTNLYNAIESYFGANIDGYDTYKYYDGNDILRSWICLPLTMGIMKRKQGTIDALFSPLLWTDDGLATEAGDVTFWDRSTLYGFRGALNAGEVDKTFKYLMSFSERRTLGDHVPYCVECYPRGLQLSAESSLYCRVVIEGIFGITPIGLNSFICSPSIPNEWPFISLNSIMAFGKKFDLSIEKNDEKYEIKVTIEGKPPKKYSCIVGNSVCITL